MKFNRLPIAPLAISRRPMALRAFARAVLAAGNSRLTSICSLSDVSSETCTIRCLWNVGIAFASGAYTPF